MICVNLSLNKSLLSPVLTPYFSKSLSKFVRNGGLARVTRLYNSLESNSAGDVSKSSCINCKLSVFLGVEAVKAASCLGFLIS